MQANPMVSFRLVHLAHTPQVSCDWAPRSWTGKIVLSVSSEINRLLRSVRLDCWKKNEDTKLQDPQINNRVRSLGLENSNYCKLIFLKLVHFDICSPLSMHTTTNSLISAKNKLTQGKKLSSNIHIWNSGPNFYAIHLKTSHPTKKKREVPVIN